MQEDSDMYTTVDDWQTVRCVLLLVVLWRVPIIYFFNASQLSHHLLQKEIDVVVFEGERPHVDANNKLWSFVISGVQRACAGEPKVDVTFALDVNGILNMSACDQVTGAEARAKIKAENSWLTSDDIDKMIANAEKYLA